MKRREVFAAIQDDDNLEGITRLARATLDQALYDALLPTGDKEMLAEREQAIRFFESEESAKDRDIVCDLALLSHNFVVDVYHRIKKDPSKLYKEDPLND
jgi:hypothetical protein